jgi:hypothetical protein
MQDIIENLSSYAEKAIQFNKPEDWSILSNQIANIYDINRKPFDFNDLKVDLIIKPYDFKSFKSVDFPPNSEEYLDKISEITQLKNQLVKFQKYEEMFVQRKIESKIIDEFTYKIGYKFSDGTFFKKNTDGIYEHLFYFKFHPQSVNFF